MKRGQTAPTGGAWLCLAGGLMVLAAGTGCRSSGSPQAAALPLSVRKEAITAGRTAFRLAPGRGRASSFEGTLVVDR
ncbi:MAG: hypothetical protein ACOC8E_05045 [Planctomycetota bacterium]